MTSRFPLICKYRRGYYKYFDKYIGNTLLRTALKPDDFIKNVEESLVDIMDQHE